MPRLRSRLKSRLAISASKTAQLTKIKALYTARASRLSFEVGNDRFDADECGGVVFDPTLDHNQISFQRPNSALTGAGKEETSILCVADTGAKATGTLDLTADITLTSVLMGTARNTNTFTLQVVAAAANPSATILAVFTGTATAIICTITPNDGTNNAATPVALTTANLTELINTGLVTGKTVTITDGSSLRAKQTATGGGATPLADTGEGDGVVATFTGGVASNLNSKYITAYSASNATKHYFYFNVNSEGVDPAVAASTGHAVAISAGATAAAVATALNASIDGEADFVSTRSTATITMHNNAAGYATDVANGGASPGFTITKLGELEQYELTDIIMIRRLRNKKWLIKLSSASDPAHDAS